jgi:hypothetical protein
MDTNSSSSEALALLWAYELNRQNMQLFKGLKKMDRRLNTFQQAKSVNYANRHPRQSNSRVKEAPKS